MLCERVKDRQDRYSVSVIIPAYNAEAFLPTAIESVLQQTCPNWELIVVENGSTDRTGEIARSYAEKYANIQAVSSEKGVSRARNKGIFLAKGDYIAFLDADDTLTPEALEQLVAHGGGADVITGKYAGEKPDTAAAGKSIDAKLYLAQCLVNPTKECTIGANLYSRQFLTKHSICFDEASTHAEDSLFHISVCAANPGITQTDVIAYQYTYSANSAVRGGTDHSAQYSESAEKIRSVLRRAGWYTGTIKTAFRFFVLYQMLILFVNGTVGAERKYSAARKQLRRILSMPVFADALRGMRQTDYDKPPMSEIPPAHRAVFFCMKYRLLPAVYLAARLRRKSNQKKELRG